MKKYRFLIEQWSDQEVIELSDEEFKEFNNMDLFDQQAFIEDRCRTFSFSTVNIELNEVKQ